MSRSMFMFAALVAVAAAAPASAFEIAEPEDYFQNAMWEDLQLLLSFVLGILCVRSAEMVLDDAETANDPRRKKLELYPLLA
mmetsp:Transcript_2896/g.4971  ORF Transcript_2896/g.4971 Transcript_2896/m.4971 type:complete len:82 (+) Transcript_2896:76-321(+)